MIQPCFFVRNDLAVEVSGGKTSIFRPFFGVGRMCGKLSSGMFAWFSCLRPWVFWFWDTWDWYVSVYMIQNELSAVLFSLSCYTVNFCHFPLFLGRGASQCVYIFLMVFSYLYVHVYTRAPSTICIYIDIYQYTHIKSIERYMYTPDWNWRWTFKISRFEENYLLQNHQGVYPWHQGWVSEFGYFPRIQIGSFEGEPVILIPTKNKANSNKGQHIQGYSKQIWRDKHIRI